MLKHIVTPDYVRGFADGEGGFSGHQAYLTNTDWRAIERIRDCLSDLGVECTLQRTKSRAKNHKPCYILKVFGVLNLARFAVLVGFTIGEKQKRLESYIQFACRKGRQYNLAAYETYLQLKDNGASIRQMSFAVGVAYNAMWKRVKNVYPIDPDDLVFLKAALGTTSKR